MNGIYFIECPTAMMFVQKDGDLVAIQSQADFDNQMQRETGKPYLTNSIRELQRFRWLNFSARPGTPHLLPSATDPDGLDISSQGLFRALRSVACHRREALHLPQSLKWVFKPQTMRMRRAEDWYLTVFPALLQRADAPAEVGTAAWFDFQREISDPLTRAYWCVRQRLKRAKRRHRETPC